jgi:hypothetical protein
MDGITARIEGDREQAEEMLARWMEEVGIEDDDDALTEEQQRLIARLKRRVTSAIEKGRLVVDGGRLVYTVSDKSPQGFAGKEVVIDQFSMKVKSAVAGCSSANEMEKEIAGISALTGLDVGFFRKLSLLDFNFFEAVLSLFLRS